MFIVIFVTPNHNGCSLSFFTKMFQRQLLRTPCWVCSWLSLTTTRALSSSASLATPSTTYLLGPCVPWAMNWKTKILVRWVKPRDFSWRWVYLRKQIILSCYVWHSFVIRLHYCYKLVYNNISTLPIAESTRHTSRWLRMLFHRTVGV